MQISICLGWFLDGGLLNEWKARRRPEKTDCCAVEGRVSPPRDAEQAIVEGGHEELLPNQVLEV